MRSRPHILIANFERRILRPLYFAYCAVALYYLWRHAWALGIAILILSLMVGGIGQGLPHRKHETLSELARGTISGGGIEGELSLEDGRALSAACLATFILVDLTTLIILLHEGWRWYWILLALVATWPLFLVVFLLLVTGPLSILRVFSRGQRTN